MVPLKGLSQHKWMLFISSILLLLGITFSCHPDHEVVPVEIVPLDTVPLDTVPLDTVSLDTIHLNPLMDSVIGTHLGTCHYKYKEVYDHNGTVVIIDIDTIYENSIITIRRIDDQSIDVDACGWWSSAGPVFYPLGSTKTQFQKFWYQSSYTCGIKIDLVTRTIVTMSRVDYPGLNPPIWEGHWSF